jgi:hypothetical protein
MATLIEAIHAARPYISLTKAISEKEFMDQISERTTLSPGVVKNVHMNEVQTLIKLLLRGTPVHTGVAIFTPSLDLDGTLKVKVRVDPEILRELNAESAFHGTIINSENIGRPSEQLVAMWNVTHPDDPVVVPTPA